MTTRQRVDATETGGDPMAQVAADIAEADEKIRAARAEAAEARRAAGLAHRYLAYTVVLVRLSEGGWWPVFAANLTIPVPTVSSLYVLLDSLLGSFHSVGREHSLAAAAVAERPDTGRAVLAYSHTDPAP